MKIKIFTDGGSRGNPGNAGFGVYVTNENGQSLYEDYRYIGIKTNNEAEYTGLLFALMWLKENEDILGVTKAEFNADSELMVKQMQGLYKVKAGNLLNLNLQAKEYIMNIKSKISFQAIRREYNSKADELANRAMDEKI